MNNRDMEKVLRHLRKDPVVKAVYDAKTEEIGPNIFRFKAEIGTHLLSIKKHPQWLPQTLSAAAGLQCLQYAMTWRGCTFSQPRPAC